MPRETTNNAAQLLIYDAAFGLEFARAMNRKFGLLLKCSLFGALFALNYLATSAWAQTPLRLPPVDHSIEYRPGELGGRMVQPFPLPGQLNPGQPSRLPSADGRANPELVADREE